MRGQVFILSVWVSYECSKSFATVQKRADRVETGALRFDNGDLMGCKLAFS